MRVFSLILLLVAVAGCERVKTRQVVDAGPVCADNEHLVNGTCRFVCNRDGDCQAGERCNLLLGTCEPKPPPVDAGPEPIPCTEGAVRCSADATTLQTCSDAGVFVVSQVCPQPDGFCENEQCLACRPGTRRCGTDTTTSEVCLDDGSGWRTITCAATAACVNGECDECTLGDRRCNATNDTVEECERTTDETRATAYTAAGDNFDGTCITQQCEMGANGPQCHPPTCVPGALACASPTLQQTCSPTGSWVQTDCVASLASSTAQCVSGACIDECADAVAAHSYFGCDYWSTIPDNDVDTMFKGRLAGTIGVVDSDFVYVIANQSVSPATVRIYALSGSTPTVIKTVTVPGRTDPTTRGLMKVPVPWKSISTATPSTTYSGQSGIAYHLTSTRPITLYQFNPNSASKTTNKTCSPANNDFTCTCNEIDNYNSISCALGSQTPGKCVSTSAGNRCMYNSYSNDASLVLPAHILGTSYVALTPESVVNRTGSNNGTADLWFTGTITIVAPENGTTVTIKAAAPTAAGGGVAAIAAAATATVNLSSFGVVQISNALPGTITNLECANNPYSSGDKLCRIAGADLTGSIITSNKPIAVFAGSPCTLRGYTDTACDHVEEQLFPFSTWGNNFVATRTAPLRLTNNTFATAANAGPDYYKIVAGCGDTVSTACPNGTNGTTITLSVIPAAGDVLSGGGCEAGTSITGTGTSRCRLRAGKFVEFRSKTSFTIGADQPIQVAQFFAGQNATTGTTRPVGGDPSQVLLPPVEQWRANYTVVTAPDMLDNYLGVVIDDLKVEEVRVDGVAVSGWTSVSGSTFKVNNVAVGVGTHTIQVTARPGQQQIPGAGVTVYGFDSYVSYGYTGGLDLQSLVTGVNPGG